MQWQKGLEPVLSLLMAAMRMSSFDQIAEVKYLIDNLPELKDIPSTLSTRVAILEAFNAAEVLTSMQPWKRLSESASFKKLELVAEPLRRATNKLYSAITVPKSGERPKLPIKLQMFLAENGFVDLNEPGRRGPPPLYIAVENNDVAMVNALLEAGADPHSGLGPYLPLNTAIEQGRDRQMIDRLIDATDLKSERAAEAFHVLVSGVVAGKEMFDYLFDKGIFDINTGCVAGCPEREPQPDGFDYLPSTPLEAAVSFERLKMIDHVLARGASLEGKWGDRVRLQLRHKFEIHIQRMAWK